jgi:NitT/TauT family transport system substrate-binding protein
MTSLLRSRASHGVLALAVLLGSAACGGTEEPAESADGGEQLRELRIAATEPNTLPYTALLELGINKGWFEEEGIDLAIIAGGGGGNTLRVTTSGDADIAITGGPSVVMGARDPNANLTIVAPWFQYNDFAWITPQADATLEGAKLGYSRAGSTTEMIVNGMLAELSDQNIEAVPVGGPGDNWAAAKAGHITAGWAEEPFISEKVSEEGASVLITAREVIGDFPADLIAVNKDYAAENADTLEAFFRVVDRLFKYVVGETEAAAKDMAPLVGVDPAIMEESLLEMSDIEQGYSLKVDPEALENLSELMVTNGQITEPVDWAQELDQQYLPSDAQVSIP